MRTASKGCVCFVDPSLSWPPFGMTSSEEDRPRGAFGKGGERRRGAAARRRRLLEERLRRLALLYTDDTKARQATTNPSHFAQRLAAGRRRLPSVACMDWEPTLTPTPAGSEADAAAKRRRLSGTTETTGTPPAASWTAMAPTEPNQAAAGDAVTEQQRQEAEAATEALFSNIDPTQQATEIESYCINCGKNVRTGPVQPSLEHSEINR